jgi:hypothetical protein
MYNIIQYADIIYIALNVKSFLGKHHEKLNWQFYVCCLYSYLCMFKLHKDSKTYQEI